MAYDKTPEGSALIARTANMHTQIAVFNADVIGLPIPAKPTRLDPGRKAWAVIALTEELTEFKTAETLEEEVDALIDFTYFALGRIVEMGIAPGGPFGEVQRANMQKQRGELSKRPGSKGFDAIKPPGWEGPNHAAFLSLGYAEVMQAVARSQLTRQGDIALPVALSNNRSAHLLSYAVGPSESGSFEQLQMGFYHGNSTEPKRIVTYVPRKPRILILGHARHGKDTVSELLRANHGFRFISSSIFCAAKIIIPAARESNVLPFYVDVAQCFGDRVNHRKFWFDEIAKYNTPDKARLGREIFSQYDVYCGLRSVEEFTALKEAGVFDVAIWVDAANRLPPESLESCTVTASMADYVFDNNGSVDDLPARLAIFLKELGL